MQAFDTGRLDVHAQGLNGPFAQGLQMVAEETGTVVVAGMFCPADTVTREGTTLNRVANTALITGGGHHLGYQKIHTYDAFSYRESDTVQPGKDLVVVDVDGVGVGVAVCFDIRFPEHFKELARRGAEVIVVPTSWADGPGKKEQWRVLTRARALDCGCYLAAADQARPGGNAAAGQPSGPTGIGHSVLVDPLGTVLVEGGYEPEVLVADVDVQAVAEARRALPLL